MNGLKHVFWILGLLALCASASAENSTRIGGYTIHHNALTTDILPAEIANIYDIQRSKRRALLNISVIEDIANTSGRPVRADIRATAKNLFGQVQPIALREIVEGDAIYYIADFPVAHRDLLQFEFEILPEGARYPLRAAMQQEFFTD